MTRPILAVLAALLLGSCWLRDPDPENRRERVTVPAGDRVDGRAESRGHYDDFDFYTEDVDGRPRGFHYDTEDLWVDGDGHLRLEYELRVDLEVLPGEYAFRVTYDLFGDGDVFRETIRFHFRVRVVDAPAKDAASGPTVLRLSLDLAERPPGEVVLLDLVLPR